MGILGRVAMKRDEYWQLILGRLRKLENDIERLRKLENDINFVQEIPFVVSNSIYKLNTENTKYLIVDSGGIGEFVTIFLPDDPLEMTNVTTIINSNSGDIYVKTTNDLLIINSLGLVDIYQILPLASVTIVPNKTNLVYQTIPHNN